MIAEKAMVWSDEVCEELPQRALMCSGGMCGQLSCAVTGGK